MKTSFITGFGLIAISIIVTSIRDKSPLSHRTILILELAGGATAFAGLAVMIGSFL